MRSESELGAKSFGNTAAELVRAARSKRGLSQRALAGRTGVSQSTVSAVESGQCQPSVMMLERLLGAAGFRLEVKLVNAVRPSELLERYQDEVARMLTRHHVSRAWVFGSVARGEDRSDSDLDLLIEMKPKGSFIDSVHLGEGLSALLGCAVDVVTTKELESNALLQRHVSRERRELRVAG
jgi:predicted nucleotidyltransferase/DNA-binding XRE family transcriptional regulator